MPKLKNSNATFWVIFKHCAAESNFLSVLLKRPLLLFLVVIASIATQKHLMFVLPLAAAAKLRFKISTSHFLWLKDTPANPWKHGK